MFELAGAAIIGLLAWHGVSLLLARGIPFSWERRREQHERGARRRPIFRGHKHGTWTDQEAGPALQPEQREPKRWRQRKRERAAKQSDETGWWTVLDVSPDASLDEIRRSYLDKIKQSHPDRVAFLPLDLRQQAETRA